MQKKGECVTFGKTVRRFREQAGLFTHTCFMVTPYDGYVAVADAELCATTIMSYLDARKLAPRTR